MAGHRAWRDDDDRRGASAGAALPARHRGPADVRPVRRRDRHRPRRARGRGPRAAGEPRAGPGRPRRLGQGTDEGPAPGPWRQAAQQGAGQHPGRLDAEPQRRGRPARPRRAAAGDRVRVQPGRLRRRGAAVPERQPAPDHAGGAGRDLRLRRRTAARTSPTRTCRCSATTSSSTASRVAWPPTTPGCCRASRSASRSCSCAGCAASCSPPRRSRSASTCRPGRWSSRSCRSGTARRTPTSRRGSTPSSPAAPVAGASTSRVTGSCSGSRGSTPRRWPVSPRPVPIRSSRPSGRRTTWR